MRWNQGRATVEKLIADGELQRVPPSREVEITELGYEAAAVLIPESSPALACDALATLLIAPGRDGEWHQGWTDAGTAHG